MLRRVDRKDLSSVFFHFFPFFFGGGIAEGVGLSLLRIDIYLCIAVGMLMLIDSPLRK